MYSLNALISLDTVLDSRDTVLTKTDKDPALIELTCMCVCVCMELCDSNRAVGVMYVGM